MLADIALPFIVLGVEPAAFPRRAVLMGRVEESGPESAQNGRPEWLPVAVARREPVQSPRADLRVEPDADRGLPQAGAVSDQPVPQAGSSSPRDEPVAAEVDATRGQQNGCRRSPVQACVAAPWVRPGARRRAVSRFAPQQGSVVALRSQICGLPISSPISAVEPAQRRSPRSWSAGRMVVPSVAAPQRRGQVMGDLNQPLRIGQALCRAPKRMKNPVRLLHVRPPGGRWPPRSMPHAADMRPLAARRLPFCMRVLEVLPSTATGRRLPRFPDVVRLPRSSHPLARPAPPGRSPRRISFAGGCAVVVRRRSGLPPGRVADLRVASQAGCLLSFPGGDRQLERRGVHWSGGTPIACEADVCVSRCRSRSDVKVPARPEVMSSFPDRSADGSPDR
jgi:hypothetical protein